MSEASSNRPRFRSWPNLEAEMRNHFLSEPSPSLRADTGDGEHRLPYSSLDLPAWQVDLIDRFPLLYRCPEIGRDDYCHLPTGFDCVQAQAPMIEAFSRVASTHLQVIRASVQPNARIEVSEVSLEHGKLRWRFTDNLSVTSRAALRAGLDRLHSETS
jgi:hypothetical protein